MGATVTKEEVEANIVAEYYLPAGAAVRTLLQSQFDPAVSDETHKELDRLTICILVLQNGFTVMGESACVSIENFALNKGKEAARRNAVEKIWPLMGYELRTRVHNGEAQ